MGYPLCKTIPMRYKAGCYYDNEPVLTDEFPCAWIEGMKENVYLSFSPDYHCPRPHWKGVTEADATSPLKVFYDNNGELFRFECTKADGTVSVFERFCERFPLRFKEGSYSPHETDKKAECLYAKVTWYCNNGVTTVCVDHGSKSGRKKFSWEYSLSEDKDPAVTAHYDDKGDLTNITVERINGEKYEVNCKFLAVPINFKAGSYPAEITEGEGKQIYIFKLDDKKELTYKLGNDDDAEWGSIEMIETYGRKRRSDDALSEPRLIARYAEDGVMECLDFIYKTFYIHYRSHEEGLEALKKYCVEQGRKIAEKMLARGGKVARVFIDYYWDGTQMDFHVKMATPEEVQQVIEEYGVGEINGAGAYSSKDWIFPDLETLYLKLFCFWQDGFTENEECYEAMCADIMVEEIKKILPQLDKTEDFLFSAELYD